MTRTPPIYPPALKKGDVIGVIAPSSVYDVNALQPAVRFLEDSGFKVVFHPQTSKQHGQFAGTADEKVQALHDYFTDPNIDAIFCTCGGNGALHLLDKIDYNLIKKNPKILIGFSDITILLNAIHAKTGLVTFHGSTLTRLDKINPEWPKQMLYVLTGKSSNLDIDAPNISVEGTLIGGNLSVMQALIGTPYTPNMENALLLLEDTNDHLSRYDRMIAHMARAGWLKNLSGVLLGDFLNSQDNKDRPFGFNIEEIIKAHAPKTPIIRDIPAGHGERLCTLPIGANITLKDNKLSFSKLA
jgi:muramoyltetrapeptide carboxypeptidase